MYKIYVNERPLILAHMDEIPALKSYLPDDTLYLPWFHRSKTVFNAIDSLYKNSVGAIVLYGENAKEILRFIQDMYDNVVACGGIVENLESGLQLMIFRRGMWDLPKGKMDPGEKKRQTAIREVQEETGIKQIEIHEKVMKTYHFYTSKKGRQILKICHWFKMTTNDQQVEPQAEEDIDIVQWVKKEDMLEKSPIFRNIIDVLKKMGNG